MSIYPYGIPSTGVYEIFQGTNFSPSDVVRAIKDNYSAVNRTTMLNSLGYQVGLVQNFINASYMGRRTVPVQNAFMTSGWFSDLIALSGSLTDTQILQALAGNENAPNHIYTWISEGRVDVKSQSGSSLDRVCGHVIITPDEIRINQSGGQSYDEWVGYWSQSGFFSDQLTFSNPTVFNGRLSNLRVNRAHKFTIANPSTVDDGAGYSGLLELYASQITLNSRGAINLAPSNEGPFSKLSFCGTNLFISGVSSAGNVFFYNNIIPLVSYERSLGLDTRYWRNAYIQQIETTANLDGAPGGTAGFYGIIGALCGQNINSDDYGIDLRLDYTCGTFLHNRTLISPNKIMIAQYESGQPVMSGYFRINNGQLEFYKIGTSGWILTDF